MTMTDRQEQLAQFVDRYTMVHEWWYPHPAERVWRALTEPQHLDVWFMHPEVWELRVGGDYAFPTRDGTPLSHQLAGTFARVEPTSVLELAGVDGAYLRYELTPDGDGTRMRFTQHFTPGDFAAFPDEGGDLPGGPGTPWMPVFVGGWHDFFEGLYRYLDRGAPEYDEDRRRWRELNVRYRQHIAATIPDA